jgi:epsilon-lactone hydrolase
VDRFRDGEGNLRLPPRTIPVPKTISPQAQRALAEPLMGPPLLWPPPHDKPAWRRFILEGDARMASLFAALPSFQGKIESKTVGSATVFELVPDGIPAEKQDRALLFVHGGAYVMGGGDLAVKAVQSFAAQITTKTYVIDYRMPPDHPYPAAVDDVLAAYRDMLTRYSSRKIAILGISAGGGLAAASILKLRDLGLPLPGAAVLLTPEADLTESGDTFETNQFIDVILVNRLTESILLYADGHDLRDPYLSPVFGDFSRGFPPTLLISGTRDLFLSNTVIFHRALRKAGIRADLHVFEAMPHGGFFGAPEDADSAEEQRRFIDDTLGCG